MLSTISPPLLQELVRQRWLLPVLARFHAARGLRFAELQGKLGLPKDSLVRVLDLALTRGWIVRNPGHGHPLRPEYVLSDQGVAIAAQAAEIAAALEQAGLAPSDLTRWSLPALQAIGEGKERFNDLARSLIGASPRALSQSLRGLVANDLVERRIEDAFPPVSRYSLTGKGRAIAG